MYCITDAQMDWMLDDFRARGIRRDSLQQDLLDHVCCIIEQSLEENGDFEGCYHTSIARFYKDELVEIETETLLLLTFKHYYTMKKIMIISGTVSVATFISGSLFKLMHWPGAALLLFAGVISFCFLFLPFMLALKIREQGALRDKIIFGSALLLCLAYFIALLFKFEHWPGASMLWYFTLGATFFVFIPAFFITGIRRPETKFNTIVTTILLVAFTAIQFMMTALWVPAQPQATVLMEQVQRQMQD